MTLGDVPTSAVTNPATKLDFHEIGHRRAHGVPLIPSDADGSNHRGVKHGQHGVITHRIRMVMHSGTHLNAAIHGIQKGERVGVLPLDVTSGNGVIPGIAKGKWELVVPADLATWGGDRVDLCWSQTIRELVVIL